MGHLVTLGIPQDVRHLAGNPDTVWPWFINSEENVCAPGVKGCTKVGNMYFSIEVMDLVPI